MCEYRRSQPRQSLDEPGFVLEHTDPRYHTGLYRRPCPDDCCATAEECDVLQDLGRTCETHEGKV